MQHILVHFTRFGFQVLTAVVIKSAIFRDIMLCSLLKASRRFGGTYRPHIQGQIIRAWFILP
jgi:hypothetical protein